MFDENTIIEQIILTCKRVNDKTCHLIKTEFITLCYIPKIKVGVDLRFDVECGYCKNMVFVPVKIPEQLNSRVKMLCPYCKAVLYIENPLK